MMNTTEIVVLALCGLAAAPFIIRPMVVMRIARRLVRLAEQLYIESKKFGQADEECLIEFHDYIIAFARLTPALMTDPRLIFEALGAPEQDPDDDLRWNAFLHRCGWFGFYAQTFVEVMVVAATLGRPWAIRLWPRFWLAIYRLKFTSNAVGVVQVCENRPVPKVDLDTRGTVWSHASVRSSYL